MKENEESALGFYAEGTSWGLFREDTSSFGEIGLGRSQRGCGNILA